MQLRNVITQPAIFFTLDGVVRQIKPEVAKDYLSEFGQIPPAPVHVGEQELVVKVVDFIREKMEETGAIPIALDMAPYVEGGVMPIENYKNILAETLVLLREAGLTGVKAYYCPHTPDFIEEFDPATGLRAVKPVPKCKCRFPNDGLIRKAAQNLGISVFNDKGAYRVLPPSFMIGNDQDARAASIEGASMNFTWVEGVINGSVEYRSMTTHAHLKAAAMIKEHQREVAKDGYLIEGTSGNNEIDVNLTELAQKLPELPNELNRPAGT